MKTAEKNMNGFLNSFAAVTEALCIIPVKGD